MSRAKITSAANIPSKPNISALRQVAKESGFDRSATERVSSSAPVVTSPDQTPETSQPRGRRRSKRAARTENLSHRVTAKTIENLSLIADALSDEQDRDVALVEALELAIAETAKRRCVTEAS